MISSAIVDSGVLLAAANQRDPQHRACLEALSQPRLRLIVPALCVAEVAYLIGKRQGPVVEARFLRGLDAWPVEAPGIGDWARIASWVERYADLPLGATDASVAVLAERYETDLILTLDVRHFSLLRPRHVDRFRLLPDPLFR
jgi:uncharacterized protein